MARVERLNVIGPRWYVRIVIPDDLRAVFGKNRVNIAPGASDRREATMKRAAWLADFDAKRADQPPRVPALHLA